MKNILKITLLICSLFVIGACTNLEEELQDQFTEDFVPQNPDQGRTANVNMAQPNDGIGAAFSRLRNGSANHGNYFSAVEISSDEAVITQKGGDWFDGGIWLDLHRHAWNSTHPALNGQWGDHYGGISECNRLIAGNEAINADGNSQLRVLRAYYYWRLMDAFGRVKLVTSPGVDAPQATRAEAFAFIESELLAAIPGLAVGRPEYGRVSQGAAYSLLARLYLNAEVYTGSPRWQDAIDAADAVINSGFYSLSDNFSAVFAPDNVQNIEQIWVIPYDEATGTNMNFAQMTLHYPSQLTYRLQEQPWNGYSTLEEFYKSYVDPTKGGDPNDVRATSSFIVGPQVDLQGNPILDLAFDPADPDGAPINYTPAINELAPSGSRQAGARLGKYSFKIGQRANMDNDYVLFRYGEVLLMKAEAVARLNGNWSDPVALALVNQLRSRAGVAAFSSMTADQFLAERGREMFQESIRRTDLIRFNKWGSAWWEKPAHNNPNLNVFPIPNDQIQASQSETFRLTQNPGY
uniref:RagB/SusD family nutrient uptake outer membrane protein n=1 Tax=Roseivirga sp. TaxID=1964215 RepID=UPI0040484EF4